jgi:hypothetical protein
VYFGNRCGDEAAEGVHMTTIQVLSLAIFAGILLVSVGFRINIGVVALPAAFLLSSLAGIGVKEVLAAFPGDLVILIIGITFCSLTSSAVVRSGGRSSLSCDLSVPGDGSSHGWDLGWLRYSAPSVACRRPS